MGLARVWLARPPAELRGLAHFPGVRVSQGAGRKSAPAAPVREIPEAHAGPGLGGRGPLMFPNCCRLQIPSSAAW